MNVNHSPVPVVAVSGVRPCVRPLALAMLGALYVAYALFARGSSLPSICPFRALTGMRCPLCGFTTALGHLMHGQFREAMRAHPLAPLIILAAGGWYLRLAITDLSNSSNSVHCALRRR